MATTAQRYDPRRIATAVRQLREAAGLTQAQLAELAELAPETISRVESGREPPSLKTLWALADALGATLDEAAGRSSSGSAMTPELRRHARLASRISPDALEHLSSFLSAVARTGKR